MTGPPPAKVRDIPLPASEVLVPDAIVLLKSDHKEVEKLFKQFEKLGDGAAVTKRKVVDQIIEALSTHAAIEEQHFYPAVRQQASDIEDTVLEGLEEHHIVKWTLSELQDLPVDHERFDAKVTVLIESVRHHVEEEEGEMFPKAKKAGLDMVALGNEMAMRKDELAASM